MSLDLSWYEKNMFRTNDVGYYAFIKWYELYIADMSFESAFGNTSHHALNEFGEVIGVRIEDKKYVPTKKGRRKQKFYHFYVSKPYFEMLKDFDFKSFSPRKKTEIIQEADGQYYAKITTIQFGSQK